MKRFFFRRAIVVCSVAAAGMFAVRARAQVTTTPAAAAAGQSQPLVTTADFDRLQAADRQRVRATCALEFLAANRQIQTVFAVRKLEKAAFLGVTGSPVAPVLREQLKLQHGMGIVVDHVEPGSPAATAGVKPYDVLLKLNDQMLVDLHQLAVLVRTFKQGDEVKLTLMRQGQLQTVPAKLVEKEQVLLDENSPWALRR